VELSTRIHIENLKTKDRTIQTEAYSAMMAATNEQVDWAYEIWDELKINLTDKDNHLRSIAGQLLSNLAKSDPEHRILNDFPAILEGTKDEKFVTARHILQSLWRIGIAGREQKAMLLKGLTTRFQACIEEKNGTLIRYDIIQVLRRLYDQEPDEAVKQLALSLIETEEDLKYRKKYATLWRKV
jgi:hypothetical protein